MKRKVGSAALAALCLGCGPKPVTLDEYHTRLVTLPGGQQIRVEVMIHPTDLMRGMMFRDSLAPDRGMLFVHAEPGPYTYWMYQVKIPLDIIWMDSSRTILEISANTPPCKTPASECPHYGGNPRTRYVLELAAGMAARYGLKVGDTLNF
jgi:uncharacterized membrane protein (UPF0127 family)